MDAGEFSKRLVSTAQATCMGVSSFLASDALLIIAGNEVVNSDAEGSSTFCVVGLRRTFRGYTTLASFFILRLGRDL